MLHLLRIRHVPHGDNHAEHGDARVESLRGSPDEAGRLEPWRREIERKKDVFDRHGVLVIESAIGQPKDRIALTQLIPGDFRQGERISGRVIAVKGASSQGLVRAIQKDNGGDFTARTLTRDVNSDKAKALAALGAEVVQADIDDPASVSKAFEGAYGAYCVTFFWAHFSPEKEQAEARNMAQAAKHAGVKHVIWSTLEDTRKFIPLSDPRMPTLQGKYKCPHFDAKGESDHFFTDLGLPVTILLTSFYWDNFIYFGMGPKKGADGALALTLPMGGGEDAQHRGGDYGVG